MSERKFLESHWKRHGVSLSGVEGDRFRIFREEDGDWHCQLLDTKTGEVVFEDCCEPEDKILTRDLNDLVMLLNELAREVEAR